mmetsp:Transcript_8159/g.28956  ORF Transcript_8159/g.28956 Transcript_8159/m.28956 type:complete len:144 (-) Transcript_8159:59-490(-)
MDRIAHRVSHGTCILTTKPCQKMLKGVDGSMQQHFLSVIPRHRRGPAGSYVCAWQQFLHSQSRPWCPTTAGWLYPHRPNGSRNDGGCLAQHIYDCKALNFLQDKAAVYKPWCSQLPCFVNSLWAMFLLCVSGLASATAQMSAL